MLHLFDYFVFEYILKCNLLLWWQCWIFSIIDCSSFQCHMIVQKCWFGAQETFLLLSMLKTVLLNSFVEIVIHYHSNFWEKFKKKRKSIFHHRKK